MGADVLVSIFTENPKVLSVKLESLNFHS